MRVRTKRCGALNPLSRRLGGLKAGAWVGGTVPMVNQEHESLLDDTKRVEGHSALRDNVAAANALADAVRSTLGPRGLDKLLVGEDGENLVTNDGVTVLETAQVEHPTAKMLISAASAQDRQALDGTTTTVLLTAELLQNGLELVERGVHPAVICAGWNMAQERAAADLLELARAPSGDDDMLQAVRTALAGKIDEGVRETLSHLAVHAARAIASEEGGDVRADPSLVKVINDVGGGGRDTRLVPGLVLPKERIHPDMPQQREAGRIILFDGSLERRGLDIQANLKVTQTGMLAELHESERADLSRRVQALIDVGIDVLIVRDGVDDEARSMLNDAGITAYRRVEKPELDLLSRATGALMVHDVNNIRDDDIGEFSSLTEENWHGVNHLIIEGSAERGQTLVVRGTSDTRLEEMGRAFNDALGVACGLLEEPSLLPGGGATQVALARRLRAHARSIPGREQLAVEAFAAALEAVPRTLAENAGLQPVDELIRLNAAQSSAENDGDWIGLDLFAGEPRSMQEAGITEPLRVTRTTLEGATEAAISVLRIDDVLWAKQDPTEPDWQDEQ